MGCSFRHPGHLLVSSVAFINNISLVSNKNQVKCDVLSLDAVIEELVYIIDWGMDMKVHHSLKLHLKLSLSYEHKYTLGQST